MLSWRLGYRTLWLSRGRRALLVSFTTSATFVIRGVSTPTARQPALWLQRGQIANALLKGEDMPEDLNAVFLGVQLVTGLTPFTALVFQEWTNMVTGRVVYTPANG